MIIVENAIVSDDIADEFFVCHLEKCKGGCCVEGDLGAPLTIEELSTVESIYPQVKPYLDAKGVAAIEQQGFYIKDYEGDFSTPTLPTGECAYAIYDDKGHLKCGIEQAYLAGEIGFRKPISCHLYPIRITTYDDFDALNYHRWHICNPACHLGSELAVPLYIFLKDALVRKYGQAWYNDLVQQIEQKKPRITEYTT